MVLPIIYDNIRSNSPQNMFLLLNKKHGLYREGKGIIIPVEYDNLSEAEDYFIARKAGKMGILDSDGKVVLPIEHDDVDYNMWEKKIYVLKKKTQWIFKNGNLEKE